MAYLIKGARALGADDSSDIDWGSIVNDVVTPQNVQAGAQAGSGLLQTGLSLLTGATGLGPKPPPPPVQPSGLGGTNTALIVGGVALAAVAAAYFWMRK